MNEEKNIQTVTILVGILGAGKSTYARGQAKQHPSSVVISGDSFREMLKPQYIFRKDIEQVVTNLTETALLSAIQCGLDPIIDEANGYIQKSGRAKLIELIRRFFPDKKELKIEAIEFKVEPECLQRRLKEPRGLTELTWTRVYNEMVAEFERVTDDEEFDSHGYYAPRAHVEVTPEELQREYCLANKHHYLIPLSGHCFRCGRDIIKHPSIIKNAATSHISTCPYCGMAWGD